MTLSGARCASTTTTAAGGGGGGAPACGPCRFSTTTQPESKINAAPKPVDRVAFMRSQGEEVDQADIRGNVFGLTDRGLLVIME